MSRPSSSTGPAQALAGPSGTRGGRLSPTGPSSPPKKARPDEDVEVLELSSGDSDTDDPVAARIRAADEARKAQRRERYFAVRNAVPSADPKLVMQLFEDPAYGGDPDRIASQLFEMMGAEKKGAGREEEEEVDQLASDEDDGGQQQAGNGSDGTETGDAGPSKKEVMEQASYWLDVQKRKAPEATLNQLYRDYDAYAELHILDRFESNACEEFYAPTWFELRRLQKQRQLLKLKSGPRNLDAPVRHPDGTIRPRQEIKKSSTLEKERRWLGAYIEFGGRGLATNKNQDESVGKKRANETQDQRRARLSGDAKGKKRARGSGPGVDIGGSNHRYKGAHAGESNAAKGAKRGGLFGTSSEDDLEELPRWFRAATIPMRLPPGYENAPAASGSGGKKSAGTGGDGLRLGASGAFRVKEEDREWFLGEGRRLGD